MLKGHVKLYESAKTSSPSIPAMYLGKGVRWATAKSSSTSCVCGHEAQVNEHAHQHAHVAREYAWHAYMTQYTPLCLP